MKNHFQEFALLSLAAFYYPGEELRNLLYSKLSNAIAIKDLEKIKEILESEKGTEYEPFSLSRKAIQYASFLTAFSFKYFGHSSIRIVSQTSPQKEGGLVLNKNLKAYYLNSYMKTKGAKTLGQPKKGLIFLPSALSGLESGGGFVIPTVQAQLISDEEGFTIVISGAIRRDRDRVDQRYQYLQNARIEGVDSPLYDLGLSLDYKMNDLLIRSGSPESMIKLLAYMSQNRTLVLRPSSEESSYPIIKVRLEPPNGDCPVRLKTLCSSLPKDVSWLMPPFKSSKSEGFGGFEPFSDNALTSYFDITIEEIQLISRWFPPPQNWINRISF